jgi:hypothetical protein
VDARPDLKPLLSVVLPALGGLETMHDVIRIWDAQARRDALELVVLCPDGTPDRQNSGVRFVDSDGLQLHEARARGVQATTAPFVFLAEDHCVPDPGWSEAMLARVAEDGYDGIGCALRPGDAPTAFRQAAFLLGYGEWLPPLGHDAVKALAGYNVAWRRELLVSLGRELPDLLLVGAFLTRRLARGRRVVVEPEATMRHFDPAGLASLVRMFGVVGCAFGAVRTRAWPRLARVAYPLALPAVAVAHWRRAAVHYRRAGRANGIGPGSLVAGALLAAVWGVGEAVGAAVGPRRIAPHAWMAESRPLRDADLASRPD